MKKLSHMDEKGDVRMVDLTDKPLTEDGQGRGDNQYEAGDDSASDG